MKAKVNLEALKQAIVKKLDPEDVPEGLYPFNHIAEISVIGAAKRLPNLYVKPTAKLPLLDILALVIAKAGIQGPKILSLIGEAAREAAAADKQVTEYLETTKQAVREVEEKLIAGITLVEKKGAFTSSVEVQVLKVRAV